MNPVCALAQTIQHILSYSGASKESSICTYLFERKLCEFTQNNILEAFCANIEVIDKDKFGFKPKDISTHSNRSTASMTIFMDDQTVYMIILMER